MKTKKAAARWKLTKALSDLAFFNKLVPFLHLPEFAILFISLAKLFVTKAFPVADFL